MKAQDFMNAGLKHMEDRAALRDQEEGERSMGRAVSAFNAIYGHEITEEQGWMFMAILKASRSAYGKFSSDDYEDGSAYVALAGEAAFKGRSVDI